MEEERPDALEMAEKEDEKGKKKAQGQEQLKICKLHLSSILSNKGCCFCLAFFLFGHPALLSLCLYSAETHRHNVFFKEKSLPVAISGPLGSASI
ncbi:MAG: hypothetical protein ABH879_05845 [archaeon]